MLTIVLILAFVGVLTLVYRVGYAIGYMDGETGWHGPYPWSETRKDD